MKVIRQWAGWTLSETEPGGYVVERVDGSDHQVILAGDDAAAITAAERVAIQADRKSKAPANNFEAGEDGKKVMPVGKRFEPGRSGNPSGRPKRTQAELDLIAACKKKAPAALKTLVELMGSENEAVRLKASLAIIERAYGKPLQPTRAEDDVVIVRWCGTE